MLLHHIYTHASHSMCPSHIYTTHHINASRRLHASYIHTTHTYHMDTSHVCKKADTSHGFITQSHIQTHHMDTMGAHLMAVDDSLEEVLPIHSTGVLQAITTTSHLRYWGKGMVSSRLLFT